nr:unknown protein [Arabidopsis thaliana]
MGKSEHWRQGVLYRPRSPATLQKRKGKDTKDPGQIPTKMQANAGGWQICCPRKPFTFVKKRLLLVVYGLLAKDTWESIMGNTSLEYASTSSGQDSVRSRGSVIPSRQFTISRGNGNVYQLAVFEAEKSKKEASLEAFKHQEVVKEKNEAIKRGKEWESAYLEELKQRKETEMELKKVREKLEKMRYISENRITESYMLVQKLQDKYNLATKVLRKAKEERDLLIKGRDIAIIEVEELRKEVSRSDEHREAPQYFICPISLEVMKDPQLAADGFTYEAEAISTWLQGGHETSPMTNTKLHHTKLVPNLALRSAIQEWLHASSSFRK